MVAKSFKRNPICKTEIITKSRAKVYVHRFTNKETKPLTPIQKKANEIKLVEEKLKISEVWYISLKL